MFSLLGEPVLAPRETRLKFPNGQPRPSLSPSSFPREKFLDFRRKTWKPELNHVVPIIRGNTAIPSGQNEPFNQLEPLASGISAAKLDYHNGSRPAQLHTNVRNDLGPYIIPTNDRQRPLLPNFFMEVKGPKGDAAEMKLKLGR